MSSGNKFRESVFTLAGYTIDASGMVWNISTTQCFFCRQKKLCYLRKRAPWNETNYLFVCIKCCPVSIQ